MVAISSNFFNNTAFVVIKLAVVVEVYPGFDIGLGITIRVSLNLKGISPILSLV